MQEIVDAVEARLRGDVRMVEFWQILDRNGIERAVGRQFLDLLWAAVRIDEQAIIAPTARFFRTVAQDMLRSERLAKELSRELEKHPELYGDARPQLPNRDAEDERIIRSHGRRKSTLALDLAVYAMPDAITLFGRPLYEAVALAVTVALDGAGGEVNAGGLKNAWTRGHDSGS